jgi:hypothetical protein
MDKELNFGEKIKIVLNKMVVPYYDTIARVEYTKFGDIGVSRYYEIIYIVKEGRYKDLDINMGTEIIEKTQRIVPMVGLLPHEDYNVLFRIDGKKYNTWERMGLSD